MSFAVFALTPKSLATGGALPPNVPNASYKPQVLYGLKQVSPWFDSPDNANLALLQVKLPEAAVALRALSDTETANGTMEVIRMESEGIMPMRDLTYSPEA